MGIYHFDKLPFLAISSLQLAASWFLREVLWRIILWVQTAHLVWNVKQLLYLSNKIIGQRCVIQYNMTRPGIRIYFRIKYRYVGKTSKYFNSCVILTTMYPGKFPPLKVYHIVNVKKISIQKALCCAILYKYDMFCTGFVCISNYVGMRFALWVSVGLFDCFW